MHIQRRKDVYQTRHMDLLYHKMSRTDTTPPKRTPPAKASPPAPNVCISEHDLPVAYFTGVNVASREHPYKYIYT